VLSDAVHPWHSGGKETRQEELWPRLVARGVDVDVYTMKWWDGPDTLVRDGVTYRAICPLVPLYRDERRSILQALVFSASVVRVIRRPFDVLEADMVPVLHLFPARVVARLRRRPLLVTWHEFWGRRYWVTYLGAVTGRVAAALEAAAAQLPDAIVAASDGTRERLLEAGRSAGSVAAVPNGVDEDSLERARRVAADEPHRGFHADLVVVGRLLSHKNVDVALRALRLLHDGGEPYTLCVVGEGPERARLEALTDELGLRDAVTFAGTTEDHTEVLATMARARVLLFPSVREGFGMVALEAMALGTPVVTSDHPDNVARFLVHDGVDGAVTSPTPEALASATRRILADGAPRREASLRAAAGFSWDALADRAAALYVSLVDHSRRGNRR